MAKSPIDVQTTVQDKVFDNSNLTTTVLIDRYSSTENEYGTNDLAFTGQDTFVGVALDYVSKAYKYDRSGIYNDSSLILLLQYDTLVGLNDVITVFGNTYQLSRATDIPYGDQIMVKRVFLKPYND